MSRFNCKEDNFQSRQTYRWDGTEAKPFRQFVAAAPLAAGEAEKVPKCIVRQNHSTNEPPFQQTFKKVTPELIGAKEFQHPKEALQEESSEDFQRVKQKTKVRVRINPKKVPNSASGNQSASNPSACVYPSVPASPGSVKSNRKKREDDEDAEYDYYVNEYRWVDYESWTPEDISQTPRLRQVHYKELPMTVIDSPKYKKPTSNRKRSAQTSTLQSACVRPPLPSHTHPATIQSECTQPTSQTSSMPSYERNTQKFVENCQPYDNVAVTQLAARTSAQKLNVNMTSQRRSVCSPLGSHVYEAVKSSGLHAMPLKSASQETMIPAYSTSLSSCDQTDVNKYANNQPIKVAWTAEKRRLSSEVNRKQLRIKQENYNNVFPNQPVNAAGKEQESSLLRRKFHGKKKKDEPAFVSQKSREIITSAEDEASSRQHFVLDVNDSAEFVEQHQRTSEAKRVSVHKPAEDLCEVVGVVENTNEPEPKLVLQFQCIKQCLQPEGKVLVTEGGIFASRASGSDNIEEPRNLVVHTNMSPTNVVDGEVPVIQTQQATGSTGPIHLLENSVATQKPTQTAAENRYSAYSVGARRVDNYEPPTHVTTSQDESDPQQIHIKRSANTIPTSSPRAPVGPASSLPVFDVPARRYQERFSVGSVNTGHLEVLHSPTYGGATRVSNADPPGGLVVHKKLSPADAIQGERSQIKTHKAVEEFTPVPTHEVQAEMYEHAGVLAGHDHQPKMAIATGLVYTDKDDSDNHFCPRDEVDSNHKFCGKDGFKGEDNDGNRIYEDSDGTTFVKLSNGLVLHKPSIHIGGDDLEKHGSHSKKHEQNVSDFKDQDEGHIVGIDEKGNYIVLAEDGQLYVLTDRELIPVMGQTFSLYDSDSGNVIGNQGHLIGVDNNKNKIFMEDDGDRYILSKHGSIVPFDEKGLQRLGEDETGKKFFLSKNGSKVLLDPPSERKESECEALLGVYPSGCKFYENTKGEIYMRTESGTRVDLEEANMKGSETDTYNHGVRNDNNEYYKIQGRIFTLKQAADVDTSPTVTNCSQDFKLIDGEDGAKLLLSKDGRSYSVSFDDVEYLLMPEEGKQISKVESFEIMPTDDLVSVVDQKTGEQAYQKLPKPKSLKHKKKITKTPEKCVKDKPVVVEKLRKKNTARQKSIRETAEQRRELEILQSRWTTEMQRRSRCLEQINAEQQARECTKAAGKQMVNSKDLPKTNMAALTRQRRSSLMPEIVECQKPSLTPEIAVLTRRRHSAAGPC